MCKGGSLLLVLACPLMTTRTKTIGKGQELLQVRLSLMKMGTIIDEDVRIHLALVWVMMS